MKNRTTENTDHYVSFMNRSKAPSVLQGPDATPNIPNVNETYVPITPSRTIITPKEIIDTQCNVTKKK